MVMAAMTPLRLSAPSRVNVRQCPAGVPSANPLAAWGVAITPRHLRGRAAFILKHRPFGSDLAHRRPPRLAPGVDRRRILFLRVERFFFKPQPHLLQHSPEMLKAHGDVFAGSQPLL